MCELKTWNKSNTFSKCCDKIETSGINAIYTTMSSLSKLFTSILNQRLIAWSSTYDIISDAQFGLQPVGSTVGASFALYAIVTQSLSAKKMLYSAVVDFKQAFDYTDRQMLWCKLSKVGIKGKIVSNSFPIS